MRLISVVGTRPQFIKLAPIVRAIKPYRVSHDIVHTGQHYDKNMSDAFFSELGLPNPIQNFMVGSGTHAEQTGKALTLLEKFFKDARPDHVLVFGDTNATLSATLAAAKMNLPISHIEAGLRSYNRSMPEEINRIITDRLSHYLFCPDPVSVKNLEKEGITSGVFQVGDVMVDQIYHSQHLCSKKALIEKDYIFMTLHRQETSLRFHEVIPLLRKLNALASTTPVIFPAHPRIKALIKSVQIDLHPQFQLKDPIGYLDAITHIQHARAVITDSGGIQKEAYLLKTPCITLRSETEWIQTLEHGWNTLVDFNIAHFMSALEATRSFDLKSPHPDYYGTGDAAKKILQVILA